MNMVLVLSINMLKTRIYAYYFLSWYVQARNMLYKMQICSIIAFCFLQTNIEYNLKLTFEISLNGNIYSVNLFLKLLHRTIFFAFISEILNCQTNPYCNFSHAINNCAHFYEFLCEIYFHIASFPNFRK